MLNTNTLKWTVPQPVGARPSGRYGHTISTIGSTLYVFGGQCDDYFFDDLVAYDLSTLQTPGSKWNFIKPKTPSPPPRTNHTMITFDEKLYLFGGTDGKLWYSDTWCFDPHTLTWTQLDCAGYIPSPCEGHSATVVGDIMYVFGGRSSEGKDLGALSALKIPSRKWFSFQNMGPGPSPRSGHSMTAFAGHKVLIMGGECPEFDPLDPTGQDIASTNLVYVLDTSRINYPPSANDVVPLKRAVDASAQLNGNTNDNNDLPEQQSPKQGYNNMAPPPPYAGNSVSPKKTNKSRDRSASSASELTPGFGYERVDVGDSRSVTDESDSYQDSQTTTPKTVETSGTDSAATISPKSEKQSEEDDNTAVINQVPSSDNSTNKKILAGPVNKTPPVIATSNSDTSQHSVDTVTADSKIGNILSPSTNGRIRTISNASPSDSQLLDELKQLRAKSAWYEKELTSARQAGYQPRSDKSFPTPSNPVGPDTLNSGDRNDNEKAELVNALSELKNELAEVRSNIKTQAEQASEKISEVEEERDEALDRIKLLEAQLNSAKASKDPNGASNATDSLVPVSRGLAPADAEHQKEISELENKIKNLENEKKADAKNRAALDEPYNADRDYDQIYARNVNLEQQLREFSDKTILANHETSRVRAQLEEVLARYKTLEDSTEDHVNTIAAATLTLSATQTKLIEADKLLTARNDEKAALLKQVADLTTELEALKAQYKSANDLIEQHRSFSMASTSDGANIEALNSNVKKITEMWAASKMFKKVSANRSAPADGSETRQVEQADEYEEIESPKVKALKSQLEDLQKLYEVHQKASTDATRDLSNSLEKVSSLKQQLAQSEEKQQAYESEIESLKSSLSDKHAELESNAAKLDTHQRSLDEVQEKLQQSNFENNDRVAILEKHGEELEQHVAELEQQLRAAKMDLEDYVEKFNQIESEYNSTLAYTTTSEKALNKTREELAKFRDQNAKLLEEVNNLKLQVSEADDEDNESVNSRGVRDTDSVLSGSIKFDRAGSGSGSRMSSTGRYNNSRQIDLQLRDLRAQIIILQEEKDDLQSKSLDLKKKLITQDEELRDANETIDRLIHQNQMLYDNQQHQESNAQTSVDRHLLQHENGANGSGMYPQTPPRSASTSKSSHAFSNSNSSNGFGSIMETSPVNGQQNSSSQHYSDTKKPSSKPSTTFSSNDNDAGLHNSNSGNSKISGNGHISEEAQPIVIPKQDSPVTPEEADQTLNSLSSELEQIRNNRERLSGLLNNNVNNVNNISASTPQHDEKS